MPKAGAGDYWAGMALVGGGFMSEKEPRGSKGRDPRETEEMRSRQSGIGRRLRQMYDDVVNEPIPDDFSDLLSQIDKSKSKK